MAFPVIYCNEGSGTDPNSGASGTKTPSTALTGTNATWTGAVVTLDGSPDLSVLADDDSDVIYIQTTTGKRFYRITAIDNTAKTVTCDTSITGTSGQSWAIGGTLGSIDNTYTRYLFDNTNGGLDAGWTVLLEDDHSISSHLRFNGAAYAYGQPFTFGSDTAGTRRTITQSTNDACIYVTSALGRDVAFRDLTLKNSFVGTRTSAAGFRCNQVPYQFTFVNVCFGDPSDTNNLYVGIQCDQNFWAANFLNCSFINCDSHGLSNLRTGENPAVFWNCRFADNGGDGVYNSGNVQSNAAFINCIFEGNTGAGIELAGTNITHMALLNCTFDSNGGGGYLQTSSAAESISTLINNIFSNNTGYGVQITPGETDGSDRAIFINNNYYSNSSSNTGVPTTEVGATTLDPGYTTSTLEVGTNMKAAGYPLSTNTLGDTGTTNTFIDLGAAQREEPAAGSSGVIARRRLLIPL